MGRCCGTGGRFARYLISRQCRREVLMITHLRQTNSDPRTRDYCLPRSRSGSPSGDLKFFLDDGWAVILNPPPLAQTLVAIGSPSPFGQEELKPATAVGRCAQPRNLVRCEDDSCLTGKTGPETLKFSAECNTRHKIDSTASSGSSRATWSDSSVRRPGPTPTLLPREWPRRQFRLQ
jgi:hypothetical protein